MQNVSFQDVLDLDFDPPNVGIEHSAGDPKIPRGELWRPEQDRRRGLIVLIHGGCWQSAYGIDHIRPLATVLRQYYFAVYAVGYRRLGDPGGGWPGTFEDVAGAIDAGAQYHRRGEPLIFMGHSAGGHLALWAAARSRLPSSSRFYSTRMKPNATLSLAGIVDLARYAEGESSCERSAATLMGGSAAEQPARYAEANPVQIGLDGAHFLQGANDGIVPPTHLAGIEGIADRVETVEGAGHFDFIHPRTPAFHRIVRWLASVA